MIDAPTIPFAPVLEVPPGALITNDSAGACTFLTSRLPTPGNKVYIVTSSHMVATRVDSVARVFNLDVHQSVLPDTEQEKGRILITVLTEQDSFYHSMKPGDALVWEDPTMPNRHMHVWTIEGIHLGGGRQESVIALKNASHTPAWDEKNIDVMYVPEVLLRGCKLMKAKRVTVTKTVGGDQERPAPTIKVEED